MKQRIENMIEAARRIGDTGAVALLTKWQADMHNNRKELPFVGRFSAGKTSLINALFGEKILPTARVETTAALTYIGNGTDRQAIIEYKDGTSEPIPFDKLSDLSHTELKEEEKNISRIDVLLPSDILANGMAIVDSPGMDTIINDHVSLAEYLLRESVMVVYVMAGPPSEFDINAMRKLQQNGVGLIVVRTHMDNLKSQEETFMDAFEHDENLLEDCLPYPVKYFALSTEKDAPEAVATEFSRFKAYLTDEVAANIDTLYAQQLSNRLDELAVQLKCGLEKEKELIRQNESRSASEIEAEIKAIEEAKRSVERSLDRLSEKFNSERSSMKVKILDEIDDMCDASVIRFKKDVNRQVASGVSKMSDFEEIFQISIATASEAVSQEVTSQLSTWVRQNAIEIENCFEEESAALSKVNVAFDSEFNIDRVKEIADRQEAILERLDTLSGQAAALETLTDEELNNLGVCRQQLEDSIAQLNAVHEEAIAAINHIDATYEPRYIEHPSKMGELFRKIGNAGDIAMLLIPAVGWEKGATMLAGKAAALAGKGGAAAKVVSTAMVGGSKLLNAAAKTDKVKDIVTILDVATKQIGCGQQGNENAGNLPVAIRQGSGETSLVAQPFGEEIPVEGNKKKSLFDYLSLSYWFGKFGEMIDPPRTELDIEYERRIKSARDACQQRAVETVRQRIEEDRALGRIKNEAEAKMREKELRAKMMESEKAQLNKQIEKLSAKKEEVYRELLLQSVSDQFKDALRKMKKHIERHIDPLLDNVQKQILVAASQSAVSQLEATQTRLQEILKRKENLQSTVVDKVKEYDSLIQSIG